MRRIYPPRSASTSFLSFLRILTIVTCGWALGSRCFFKFYFLVHVHIYLGHSTQQNLTVYFSKFFCCTRSYVGYELFRWVFASHFFIIAIKCNLFMSIVVGRWRSRNASYEIFIRRSLVQTQADPFFLSYFSLLCVYSFIIIQVNSHPPVRICKLFFPLLISLHWLILRRFHDGERFQSKGMSPMLRNWVVWSLGELRVSTPK